MKTIYILISIFLSASCLCAASERVEGLGIDKNTAQELAVSQIKEKYGNNWRYISRSFLYKGKDGYLCRMFFEPVINIQESADKQINQMIADKKAKLIAEAQKNNCQVFVFEGTSEQVAAKTKEELTANFGEGYAKYIAGSESITTVEKVYMFVVMRNIQQTK